MSRKAYVHDTRYSTRVSLLRHRLFSVLKIFALIVTIIGVLYAAYIGVVYNSNQKTAKEYELFHDACNNQEYETAIGIYRRLHERILTGSFLFASQSTHMATMLKIEGEINDIIAIPFNSLVQKQKVLTDDDLDMLEAFSEISVMKISDLLMDYLEQFLLGRHDIEDVRQTLAELKKVDSINDSVIVYESEIGSIAAFTPVMLNISQLYDDQSYLEAIQLSQSEIIRQSGFVKEYLLSYVSDLKNEAYPIIVSEIDVMMSTGKYYSAKALLEQVMIAYPSNDEFSKRLSACGEFTKKKLVEYSKPIEHIAIRPLISTPGFRFDKDEYSKTAEDLMLTAVEFKRILEQLYANHYVLIDINSLVDSKGIYHPIKVPEGTKPLILSIEGLNYYASRRFTGNSQNISLDKNGDVVSEYYGKNGEVVVDRNGEAIGILEQFIEKNPDFSFDGAKGNISLTGFECIFGYITDKDQIDDRTSQFSALGLGILEITDEKISLDRLTVKSIISKLLSDGWTFSSSTYGNIMVSDASLESVKADTIKWQAQVGQLVGAIKVILFPNGGVVSSKDDRGAYLIDAGFVIHCGIGPTAYFNIGSRNLFMDRIALNGYALRNYNLSRFFDVKYVYDGSRSFKLP
ncbi:MAG: hypothetical protein ACYC5K_06360 [Saccharofermentanales bacterium]